MIEFFLEGTRARSNKMLSPKFGIMNIVTGTYFDKKVDDVIFIPVGLNYTRVLEGETFPGELTG